MIERNERIQAIYDEEGMDYGPFTSNPVELERREKIAKDKRNSRINDVITSLREIEKCHNLQLCFLFDATGSMDEYILEVKNKIYRIIEKLTAQNVKDEERAVKAYQLALVAYRDFDEKGNPVEGQLEVFPFQSANVNEFRNYCGNVRAYGGGDGAEDVFGGLEAALKLKWSPNYSTKVIFHIADAPCHGIEFHNSPGKATF